MSLNEMLATWPRERLVKELALQAKDNVALRERVARLECELFWLKVPAAALPPPTACRDLMVELTGCAGGLVNGNRLAARAAAALAADGDLWGFTATVDPRIPAGEIHIKQGDGKVVGKIINVGATARGETPP